MHSFKIQMYTNQSLIKYAVLILSTSIISIVFYDFLRLDTAINTSNGLIASNLDCSKLINEKLLNEKTLSWFKIKENNNRRNENNVSMLFIVGMGGSGTTLLRTILDVSPRINCGHETHLIPRILNIVYWFNRTKIDDIYRPSVDIAMQSFLIKILETNKISNDIDILCAKDPATISYIDYLHKILPSAKFIIMLRDGRGAALSRLKRRAEKFKQENMKINTTLFYEEISSWNAKNQKGLNDCNLIGKRQCIIVKYEDLVLKSEETIRNVLKYLDVEFDQSFLKHEEANDEVVYSKNSTQRKIYSDMLKSWRGFIEYDKQYVMNNFPMMKVFGYEIDLNDHVDGMRI